MEQSPEVEILVHIGAPSRVADDARYRSLAAAYIDFEPTAHTPLYYHLSSSAPESSKERRAHSSGLRESSQQEKVQEDASTSSQSHEYFGSLKSPQASFGSVIDNATSPRLPARQIVASSPVNSAGASIPATQSSWQTPPSVVEDSHPLSRLNDAALSSPTRVLEHYLQYFDSSPETTRTDTQRSRRSVVHDTPLQRESHRRARERAQASIVPCTPPMVPCTPRPKPQNSSSFSVKDSAKNHNGRSTQVQHQEQQDEMNDDKVIEETILISSSSGASAVTRADSEPPPKRQQRTALESSPRAIQRAASDIGPRSSTEHKSLVTITFLSVHGFTFESLEIRAPEPPASVSQVEAQDITTPGLRKLAHDLDIPKRFRPREQKRDLRPFERGHWLLDCSSWAPHLKRDAWAYLANYIGTGVAGWGVWCTRDPDFMRLRAYCWGSIAAHIYLLLYLASQRNILYTGSSWIDGSGEAVMIMDVKDK